MKIFLSVNEISSDHGAVAAWVSRASVQLQKNAKSLRCQSELVFLLCADTVSPGVLLVLI